MKSRLRHNCQKSERFKAYRFTTRIGARNYNGIVIVAKRNAYRHDGCFIYKRMACANKITSAALVKYRLGCIKALRKRGRAKAKRNFGYIHIIKAKRIGNTCNRRRKLGKHALYFKLFLIFKHTKLVICLNNRHRLNEHGCAGWGGVVNKALYLVSVLYFNGNNVTSATLRYDIFLKIFWIRAAYIFCKRFLYFLISNAYFTANIGKSRACLVGNHILGNDWTHYSVLNGTVGNKSLKNFVKRGIKGFIWANIIKQRARRAQKKRRVQKLARCKRCAFSCPLAYIVYVNYRAKRRHTLCLKQAACVGRLFLRSFYLLGINQRFKRERTLLCSCSWAKWRKHRAYFIKFKSIYRFFGYTHNSNQSLIL